MTEKARKILGLSLLLNGLLLADGGVKTDSKSASLKKKTEHKPAVVVKKEQQKKLQEEKPEEKKPKVETVNKIAMIVYTDDAPIIITQLDLDRRSLDGRVRTKEEVLLERLAFHEAVYAYRMPLPDDLVDKHIISIKQAHGISEEQIAQMFEREGYTFQEGKEQLRMSYAIQSLEQHLITGRLLVTEDEIQEYYKKHPAKEPASFRIKKGIISKEDITENEVKALTEDGLYEERVQWGNPYWLDQDEIADSKRFIITMKPGQIRAVDAGDHYEIITLLKRKKERVKTLDECRREISDRIKMPKYRQLKDEFYDKLLKKYEIVNYI